MHYLFAVYYQKENFNWSQNGDISLIPLIKKKKKQIIVYYLLHQNTMHNNDNNKTKLL